MFYSPAKARMRMPNEITVAWQMNNISLHKIPRNYQKMILENKKEQHFK